jgi:hypothetical protein
MNDCHVLFDLSSSGFRAWPVLVGGVALMLAGGLVAWFVRNASPVKRWSLLLFAIAWTSLMVRATLIPYVRYCRALARGDFQIARGPITEYRALGARNTGLEYFVVDGKRFAFSEFSLAPGFKMTRRNGGNLDVGTYVRVAHRSDTILRLEVCAPYIGAASGLPAR